MLIGELEPGKLEYDNIAFQILLMIFVFLMVIVMMNLFNALAISNIEKILADGKIIGIQNEINNIHKMERKHLTLSKICGYLKTLFRDKLDCFLKNTSRDVYLFKNDFKKNKVVCYSEVFWPKSVENLYSNLPPEEKSVETLDSKLSLRETLYKKWMEWWSGGKKLLEESKRLELSAKRRKKNEIESIEELMEKLENLECKLSEEFKKILKLLTELQHSK